MIRLLLIFMLCGFYPHQITAQQKNPKTASAPKTSKSKSQKTKVERTSKAGKSDPKEKGSGMTVPEKDQPNLDKKPNPASTVPTRHIPADNDGRTTP